VKVGQLGDDEVLHVVSWFRIVSSSV